MLSLPYDSNRLGGQLFWQLVLWSPWSTKIKPDNGQVSMKMSFQGYFQPFPNFLRLCLIFQGHNEQSRKSTCKVNTKSCNGDILCSFTGTLIFGCCKTKFTCSHACLSGTFTCSSNTYKHSSKDPAEKQALHNNIVNASRVRAAVKTHLKQHEKKCSNLPPIIKMA